VNGPEGGIDMQLRDLRKRSPAQLWRGAKRRALTLKFNVLSQATRTARSCYGPRLVIRPGDATFRFYMTGTYGTFLSSYLANISEPYVFLDIGANMGLFSILAAANKNCASVVAFEPVPATYAYLVQNCQLNGATKVAAFCAAVTPGDCGIVRLQYDERHSGAARLAGAAENSPATIASMAAGPAALDEILRGSRPIKIVAKIDVEGAEVDVLRTLEATSFLEQISDVFIEVSQRNAGRTGVDVLCGQLQRLRYAEIARNHSHTEHYDAHFRRQPGPVPATRSLLPPAA
jgi:FkbM family methyltransferase